MSIFPYDSYFTDSSELAENSFGERWFLGGSSGGNGWGSSPAVSALGLLAFLFFLNLIQTSLATSRWLTLGITGATIPISNPGIITASARSVDLNSTKTSPSDYAEIDRIERERQKRSSDFGLTEYRLTPEFISAHPIGRKILELLRKFTDPPEESRHSRKMKVTDLAVFVKNRLVKSRVTCPHR